MSIRENFKDIILVDEAGRVEYFSISSTDFFDLKPEEMLGTKAHQHYQNLDEENSTLMRALRCGESQIRLVQELDTAKGKVVRQESDTFCIRDGNEIIGAIEFAYYDENRDVIRQQLQISKEAEPFEPTFHDIIGCSKAMRDIKRKLEKVADLEAPILLTGETGTGKEMTAKAIHNDSRRRKGNFIYVNCGALPETLIESILFGTKKGSFTDAAERDGLFVAADKGTIFLDEIHTMPLATQGKILRVIEEKRIRPIGGEAEISVDVRIIASCNLDVETLIYTDTLRKDLYFRLSVIQFELPPLRQRREDILPIAEYYIRKFNAQIGNREISGLDESAADFFARYDWPGNVRELKNVIEGAFYSARSGIIRLQDIQERFESRVPSVPQFSPAVRDFLNSGCSLKSYIEEFERDCTLEALKNNGGDLKKAAKVLGVSDQMMKYNIEKFEINLEDVYD